MVDPSIQSSRFLLSPSLTSMAVIRLPCPSHLQGTQTAMAKSGSCACQTATRMRYPSYHSKTKKNLILKPPRINEKWLISAVGGKGNRLQPNGLTASDAIVQFYECINNKNLKKMKDLVSEDCCFEDHTFVKPFQGRKEVLWFFEQLTECMGRTVKFIIQSVCEGDNLSVAITWHLEWKGKVIPFTTGCSFYDFSKQGDTLVIQKARVMIESPVKAGALALAMLKVVIYLFDEFPGAAEKFLQKPQAILEFLQRVYVIFLEPFLRPVMEFYINFWKLVARMLGYMINILLHISRIFLR